MIAQEHGYYPSLREYLRALPEESVGEVLRMTGIIPPKRGSLGVWRYREGQGWAFFTYGSLSKPPYGER